MTQLTPEELAACREAYCKEYGYDPEWDVVIDEDFQKAFSAGLFHKQAESAKEIAELQEQLSNRVSQTAAIALDMRREQAKNREAVREIADLKAQLDCNIDICKQVQEERDRLKAQVEVMRKDAERYQRLGWLVEDGDWGVFFSRTIGSHGNTEDTYMDDKSHMDICLDAPETIEDAEIIRRVTESRAAIEQEKQNDH